jgi:hypothetical protein
MLKRLEAFSALPIKKEVTLVKELKSARRKVLVQ